MSIPTTAIATWHSHVCVLRDIVDKSKSHLPILADAYFRIKTRIASTSNATQKDSSEKHGDHYLPHRTSST